MVATLSNAPYNPGDRDTGATFLKYISQRSQDRWMAKMKVEDVYLAIGMTKKQLYPRVYWQEQKHGKQFSFIQAINGIAVRRDK